jgi:hypothetical protein
LLTAVGEPWLNRETRLARLARRTHGARVAQDRLVQPRTSGAATRCRINVSPEERNIIPAAERAVAAIRWPAAHEGRRTTRTRLTLRCIQCVGGRGGAAHVARAAVLVAVASDCQHAELGAGSALERQRRQRAATALFTRGDVATHGSTGNGRDGPRARRALRAGIRRAVDRTTGRAGPARGCRASCGMATSIDGRIPGPGVGGAAGRRGCASSSVVPAFSSAADVRVSACAVRRTARARAAGARLPSARATTYSACGAARSAPGAHARRPYRSSIRDVPEECLGRAATARDREHGRDCEARPVKNSSGKHVNGRPRTNEHRSNRRCAPGVAQPRLAGKR